MRYDVRWVLVGGGFVWGLWTGGNGRGTAMYSRVRSAPACRGSSRAVYDLTSNIALLPWTGLDSSCYDAGWARC